MSLTLPLFSQLEITTDTTTSIPMGDGVSKEYDAVYRYNHSTWFPIVRDYTLVDTSIDNSHRPDPIYASKNLYATLGITGQANFPMNFMFERKHGFLYKTMPYGMYLRTFENWQWHYTADVYTRIDYQWGSGKENMFNVVHAQTMDNVNFELGLNTHIAEGLYVRQGVRDVNVGAKLGYELPSKRYGFTVGYIYNLIRVDENGGILADSLFEKRGKDKRDPSAINVKLSSAGDDYQDHRVFFRQYVSLSPKKKSHSQSDSNYLASDSTLLDSTLLENNLVDSSFLSSVRKGINLGSIIHDFEYTTLKSFYTDNALDLSLFPTVRHDSTKTLDSIRSYQIKNSLMWANYLPSDTVPGKPYFLLLAFGASHTFVKIRDSLHPFKDNLFSVFGNVHIGLFSKLDIKASAIYTLSGYNQNDLTASAAVIWNFNRKPDSKHSVGFLANFYNFQPDYFFTRYYANSYSWEINNLEKQQVFHAGAEWKWKFYSAQLNYYHLNNYIMMGNKNLPMQLDKGVNVAQLATYIPFRYKNFGFDVNLYVQYSNSSYIQIPIFASRESVFYGVRLFKKSLYLQFGLEFLYNTSYYANAYNPVMQQFYHQKEKKIGNYGYFDFFINAKIRRFYLHFVLSNFLADVFQRSYYMVPHYPQKNLNFKFGASWRFYD